MKFWLYQWTTAINPSHSPESSFFMLWVIPLRSDFQMSHLVVSPTAKMLKTNSLAEIESKNPCLYTFWKMQVVWTCWPEEASAPALALPQHASAPKHFWVPAHHHQAANLFKRVSPLSHLTTHIKCMSNPWRWARVTAVPHLCLCLLSLT